MKLYTFVLEGIERLGAQNDDGNMVDLLAASGGDDRFASMLSLIRSGEMGLELARRLIVNAEAGAVFAMEGLLLAAPIPRPPKLRGHSTFEAHLLQSAEGAARRLAERTADPLAAYEQIRSSMNLDKMPSPGWYKTPGYYLMDTSLVIGTDREVVWPAYSNWIDYELELVAVIGTPGKDISAQNAQNHIFGYTMVNDLSARDAQLEAMATGMGPAKGKDFDDSNPMGPCIVTADEIPDPYALMTRVRINGEQWSQTDGRAAQFRFDQCIAYASMAQALQPGELISTGTLPGCSSLELQRTVHRGDLIEFEVDRIGILRVRIRP